jgi:hypothetical protein
VVGDNAQQSAAGGFDRGGRVCGDDAFSGSDEIL